MGDSIGAGLQFLLVRVIETSLGRSTIFIWQELGFVATGTISGRTALSILLWIGGVVLLGTAAALILSNHQHHKRGVTIYGIGCALLFISTMVQYGPFFNGPAGIAIPIGLPALVFVGYFLWKDVNGADSLEEDEFTDHENLSSAESPAVLASPNASADD